MTVFNLLNILELAQREPGKLFIFFKLFWRPPDISIELKKNTYLTYLNFFFFILIFVTYPGTGPERTRETFFWRPPDCFFWNFGNYLIFLKFSFILELAQREPGKLFIFFNLKFLEASRNFENKIK